MNWLTLEETELLIGLVQSRIVKMSDWDAIPSPQRDQLIKLQTIRQKLRINAAARQTIEGLEAQWEQQHEQR